MEPDQLESIHLRMQLARDKLIVARDLLRAGHYNDVVSKAYYAMFYASKAILWLWVRILTSTKGWLRFSDSTW